jgi:hypothetical protein
MEPVAENNRKFIVVGNLECEFKPEGVSTFSKIKGLTIELWHKSPIDVVFLGRGETDENGDFYVPFNIAGSPSYLVDGEIINVFIKVYYRGVLLSGSNPYSGGRMVTSTRPLKDFTLREGHTDLGSLQIDVTAFEFSFDAEFVDENNNAPRQSWDMMFGAKFSNDAPIPEGYRFEFEVGFNAYPGTLFSKTLFSTKEGFAKLPLTPLPCVPEPSEGEYLVQLKINEPSESTGNNFYLKITDGTNDYYTLITDLILHNDKLSIFDGDSTYYELDDDIEITYSNTVIIINEGGVVYALNPANNRYGALDTLTFYEIEFPDELDVVSDGIYETNANTGTVTSGTLGESSTPFEDAWATVKNASPAEVLVNAKIFQPGSQTLMSDTNVFGMPGSKNIIQLTADGTPPTNADDGPNLSEIETVSGITFSTAFSDFISTNNLNGLVLIKNAGPIEYLVGLPTEGVTTAEKELLQSHVDLYTINEDIESNQHLIEKGYKNLFDIANTPKDDFLGDAVSEDLPFYKAAEIQEVIIQNQKLITNLLAARMSDYELADPVFPSLSHSDFAETEFASLTNKCECDDCKSGVSPFAYFIDLIKYGARHIRKTGTGAYSPVNYSAFLSLMEDYFIQPFGSLSVDCDTLHDQFCRVRLVTEVLEKYVDQQSLPQPVLDKLEDDRKKYLLLTYRTILEHSGSSYEELRDIVKTQPLADKEEKAEKWASKIGIPLEVPGSSELTADRIWLTFDNGDPDYELDGENLEKIFGFRDTQRDVLTTPPESFISEWKQVHLKDLWRKADYPFSSYSRENVNPTDDSTIKENWLPIVDPDIIGRSDLTYLSLDFAKELLKHRKAETDSFLKYYITDSNLVERTSVDMENRILRVPDRDITSQEIEGNEIQIEDSSNVFQTFNLLNRSLVELDTDVILKKSTLANPQPNIFQPNGSLPVMRYMRILNVGGSDISIDNSGPIVVTIDFDGQPLFQDVLSGGLLKLTSDNSTDIYTNVSPAPNYGISNINYDLPDKVSFEISQEDVAFFSGNLKVVYGVEVPLYTTLVPNPEAICDELFTQDEEYDYLLPVPSGETSPFLYKVWDEPSTWPSGIGSGLSRYNKLKALYQIVISGNATNAHHEVITNNLFLDTSSFIRMMEILITCENYLDSMYTAVAPTEIELYGLSSIFRVSAKHQLRKVWIIEEIKHDPAGGTDYIELMLDGQYFWKALKEPQNGVLDPMLQTIPLNAGDINNSHIPIIDPELLKAENLLTAPDAKPYRDLYFDRKDDLEDLRDEHLSWLVPFNVEGFEDILNHINTDDENIPYTLPDYADLESLIEDFESTDPFRIHKAETNLWEAFRLTGEDFGIILPIKLAYEAEDPVNVPSTKELKTAVELLTSGYKRLQLYGDDSAGWIEQEVTGSFPGGDPVKYYNVRKMQMPAYRGSFSNRSEWQRTLEDWNRTPVIQPDIVPPENINEFINGAIVHDIWVARKDDIDALRSDIATLFNDGITPDSDLLDNYELLLAMAIARTDDDSIDVQTYLAYFLNLEELENAGEDIRPYLELYGINISAYRVLQSVYHIIKTAVDNSQPIDLLDSEYTDVVDILVAIHSRNIMPFEAIQEEFNEDIILSGEDFQNYKPSPVELSVTLNDEPNKWRSPHSLRKAWKDTLETRIDRSENVMEQWADVLIDTEEITMPMMRDALIEALRNNCESFESACERLAQRFYIETKDNCCVKHSRVSFAIETIQGFIFSLENGIFDDQLNDFSISAPNFKREWEWIGSYATWRSAVFTYLFPENLLYPTLKRLQSPPFRDLSQTIRNANRFSPEDACKEAKKFEEHFEDLQHLKIICTTNTQAYFYNEDPFDCCGDMNNNQRRYTTFYFAQSEVSGKCYWSEKPYYYTDESQHSFWEELPLEKNVDILGGFALARNYDDNHQPTDLALWLFYTYKQEGKMKMAYIKKDLMTAGSSWSEETEIELPDLTDLVITEFDPTNSNANIFNPSTLFTHTKVVNANEKLIKVTACQHSVEWDWASFIFTFKGANNKYKHIHVRYIYPEDTFDDENLSAIIVFKKDHKLPVTGVKHELNTSPFTKPAVTVMFEDEIQTGYYGSLNDPQNVVQPSSLSDFDAMVGCYRKSYSSNQLIVFERTNTGSINSYEVTFTLNGTSISAPKNSLSDDAFIQNIRRVAPIFKHSLYPGGFAVEAYSDRIAVGARLEVDNGNLLSSHKFGLAIEKVSLIPVHSADCIEDFDLRIQNIKKHLQANLSAPQGNPIGNFIRTNNVKAYLYEAYYFVPMLIALDQQQRGQFEAALSWYRSVYDYTNNITTKRKVFYGLVLEQSITNVYQRPADWLLDPLNPHLIAETRANAYTKYTLMNIVQCMVAYADREFTMDTIETVPRARKLYTEALSLLKVKELNQKPSSCTNLAYACLEQDVLLPADGYWNNSFNQLQGELASYNDIDLIETTADAIKSIFENGELTTEEKFSSAFDYVDTHAPDPGTPESTTELMNGLGERMNNAYRFLIAGIDTHSYNSAVAEKVGVTVGEISKLPPEELGTSEVIEKISWLKQPEKENKTPFEFEFTDASGVQQLEGVFAYDPLVPYKPAYQANLVYSNALELYHREIYREPFTPLIDYRFCLPENPVYDSLQLKANLELYKIHNCRNIAGMVRELDIFAAPTDSTTGVPIIGAGGNLVLPGVGNFTPSQYRFRVLIERAKQLVSQAQQLESQFLATLEKEDAERYSLMRARQDLQTAKATIKLQDLRVRQANNELDLAELQLDKVEFSFDHFEDLIDTGLIGFEVANISLLQASAILQLAAGISLIAKQAAEISSGQFIKSIGSLAESSVTFAQALSTQANVFSQLASYQRRAQEWEYQKELAGFDIQISKQQIKIAEDNIRIVGQERKISEMNAGHAEDTLEFLKTKFTNVELYRWMGNILERSYSYMLSLATAVARTAERQYYFEQQEQAGPFILNDYWEVQETGAPTQGGGTDRRGLTGSVRLLQDITRLDQFAFENTKRKLQITKTVSLAQLFPEEFQTFRETGVFDFELTNQMFDYDYPGQYLRLIKGVRVAVIGLTPVNDGIKAMLTAGSTSYTVIEANNTFQRVPIRRLENEEIALSSPLSNNGLFELQPTQQEFLNPFEGMGIESRWEFKMPKYSNRMDYSQVADVLVEIEYTALDNFQYRYQVLQENDNRYDFNRGFSFKNDFPDQWYELAEAQEGPAFFGVEFEIKRDSFPQGLDNIQLDGSDLLLHFVREDGFTDEITIADFNLSSADPETEMEGETLNGTFRAVELTNVLNGDGTPFVTLRLYFDNTAINRELFSEEKVQDILLLMSCKAELPNYPL